eukprot:scaffold1504_cov417-Prasinococcus_capsulatus_cf.AAC.43
MGRPPALLCVLASPSSHNQKSRGRPNPRALPSGLLRQRSSAGACRQRVTRRTTRPGVTRTSGAGPMAVITRCSCALAATIGARRACCVAQVAVAALRWCVG